MNGDLITQFSVVALLNHHITSEAMATVGVYEHRYRIPYGVVSAHEDGVMLSIAEKPVTSWPVNAGVYVLVSEIFQRVEPGRTVSLPDLMNDLVEEGKKVQTWKLESDWLDVGRPSELHRARTGEHPVDVV